MSFSEHLQRTIARLNEYIAETRPHAVDATQPLPAIKVPPPPGDKEKQEQIEFTIIGQTKAQPRSADGPPPVSEQETQPKPKETTFLNRE